MRLLSASTLSLLTLALGTGASAHHAAPRPAESPAIVAARAAADRHPDGLDERGRLADLLLAAERLDEAETEVQLMLDLRPQDPRGLVRAGELRLALGDPEGAWMLVHESLPRLAPADRELSRRLWSLALRSASALGLAEDARHARVRLGRLQEPRTPAKESAVTAD